MLVLVDSARGFALAVFRAAFAFAIWSLRAAEEFDTFRADDSESFPGDACEIAFAVPRIGVDVEVEVRDLSKRPLRLARGFGAAEEVKVRLPRILAGA